MKTEIERLFFDKFGIEPKHNDGCKLADNYWNNEKLQKQYKTFDEYLNTNCTEGDSGYCFSTCDFAYDDMQYPKITDTILIKLLVILGNTTKLAIFLDNIKTKEDLKYQILDYCIDDVDKLKEQAKQLFKED